MSPEQAAGMTDLDERTDVYSLAVVIYEMLVGAVPGRWPTEEAVRAGRCLEAPAAHRSRLAQVGSVVEGALVRGMAIRHEQRTATPEALIAELTGAVVPRRRYSDVEVQEIVKRASEIEASQPTVGGAMTVGGVEALAAEVGIAPEAVREAARSLRATASEGATVRESLRVAATDGLTERERIRPNPWIGGPTRLSFERVVEGEVPDAEFPTMVEEIRRVLNHPGQVSQLGRSFSWTSARSAGTTRGIEIAVSVRAGRTRITAQESLGNLIGGIFGVVGGGVGGGGLGLVLPLGGAIAGPMGIVLMVPVWLSAVYLGSRVIYRSNVRSRAQQLEGLVDRLAALASELAPGTPALRTAERRLLR